MSASPSITGILPPLGVGRPLHLEDAVAADRIAVQATLDAGRQDALASLPLTAGDLFVVGADGHPTVLRYPREQDVLLGRGADGLPAWSNTITIDTLYLNGLTATRLLQTDGSQCIASVSDLTTWIGGTAKRVTVADDGDGTVTLSGPQDIDTQASPTFAGLTLSDLTDTHVLYSASGVLSGSAGHTWDDTARTLTVLNTSSNTATLDVKNGNVTTRILSTGTNQSQIGSFTNNALALYTNSTERWTITAGGDLRPKVDGAYDIATASTRVGTGYFDALDAGASLTMGGDIAMGDNNIDDLGNITFKTGASGGTLRTGTSAADNYKIQAYDTNAGSYITILEADAGTDPVLQLFADYLQFEDTADPTKIAKFDASGITTMKTRTYTFPDYDGTIGVAPTALTDTRVVFADANGGLTDDADLTYASNTLTLGTSNTLSIGAHGQTLGTSDLAVGSATDNHMEWDDSDKRLHVSVNEDNSTSLWLDSKSNIQVTNTHASGYAIFKLAATSGKAAFVYGAGIAADEFQLWSRQNTSTPNFTVDNDGDVRVYNSLGVGVAASGTAGVLTVNSHANFGTTTLAAAQGDAAFGITGSGQFWFDESAATAYLYNSSGVQTHVLNADGETVFNEGGADVDFRIESTGANKAFYINAGTGEVEMRSFTNFGTANFAASQGDISAGLSGAAAIFFDASAAELRFFNTSAVRTHRIRSNSETVFNDANASIDFRVKGASEDNLLFIDTSLDAIGMGFTPASTERLLVQREWTNTTGTRYGIRSTADSSPGSNGTHNLYSHHMNTRHKTAFNANVLAAFNAIPQTTSGFSSGTVVQFVSYRTEPDFDGAGTITTYADILCNAPIGTTGTRSNYVQVFLKDPGASAGSNIYGIRQQGTNAHNRLNGATTIGADSAPTSGFECDVRGDLRVSEGLNVGGTTDPGSGVAIITSELAVGQTGAPAGDAFVEFDSTTGFVLLPRMNTTQRDGLTAVAGAIIFNTTDSAFQGYDGTSWNAL